VKSLFSLFSRATGDRESPVDENASPADTLQRSTAAVSASRSPASQLQTTVSLLLIGSLGVGLLTWYYSTAFSRVSDARAVSRKVTAAKADAESILPPINLSPPSTSPYRIGSILGDPSGAGEVDSLEAGDVDSPGLSSPSTSRASKTPEELEEARQLNGLVFARPTLHAAATGREQNDEDGPRPTPARAPETRLSSLLEATPVATARASLLPTRRLLLPKGSFLDCTLETAMDSSLPGLATCLTAVDTFSADGTVVLLERGTKLIGETRGEVAQGASRIFVLWTEARTPTGVVVPVASPGTDELGRSGLPGAVNRHFWDRFGAAILVSVIDGAVQSAAANQSRERGAIIVNPNGTREVTTEILRDTMRIAPTVTKHQGDRIQILVARDLDFRGVYELHAR
jgi:type IV secretion system protein VirB10